MECEIFEFEDFKSGKQMKISSADLKRLLETVSGKTELKNKIDIGKIPEETSGTDIKKWPRSLTC